MEWNLGDLGSMSWEREFDFVVMTGHAFQVLLGDDELRAALGAVRAALTDGGQFGFETRDPLARAWESWTTETPVEVAAGAAASMRMTRQVRSVDGEIVVFTSTFDIPGGPPRDTATAPCAFSAPTGPTCSSPGRGRPSMSGTATGPVVRRARGVRRSLPCPGVRPRNTTATPARISLNEHGTSRSGRFPANLLTRP